MGLKRGWVFRLFWNNVYIYIYTYVSGALRAVVDQDMRKNAVGAQKTIKKSLSIEIIIIILNLYTGFTFQY